MRIFCVRKFQEEVSDERGAGTAFAMLFALICIGIGGLAVDASNVWSVRQRLQSVTDIAAHTAALSMVFPDTFADGTTTEEIAISMMLANMPEAQYGVSLQASNIVTGYWNPASSEVIANSVDALGNKLMKAVSVTARLDGEVGNVVPTFFLKLVGFDFWRVSTTSVFVRDTPDCFEGGFIAGGVVDVASNNNFDNGFCIHGNEGVDVNSNILFGSGVRVSMPNSALASDGGMFAERGTGHVWEDGRDNQVGDQFLEPSLSTVASIDSMIAALSDPNDPDLPDYIHDVVGDDIDGVPVEHITVRPNAPLTEGQLVRHGINIIDCPNKGLDFPNDMVIEDVIVIANCKIKFNQGAVVENAIIVTTNTGNQSISTPSSLQLGRDDHCATGGGVTLITKGDAHFSAQTSWYGAQVISNGDVHVSAIGNGIEGISVEAAGDIFATSNLNMGLCESGVDPYKTQYIIKMVY